MKCVSCDSRKGKRVCPRYNNQQICQLCCGTIRNYKDCSINCPYFPEQPGPGIIVKGAEIQAVETGDINKCCDILYLPNLYEHISCRVIEINLHYHNLQTLRLKLSFVLTKHFASNPDFLLIKEPWKKEFFPFEAEGLFPLVGVALPPRGLFVLGEKEITLSGSNGFAITPTQWIISSPNQRPVFPNDGHLTHVNYVFIKNVMTYGELHFDREYSLELSILNSTGPLNMEENTVESQIGIVLPFGHVEFVSPKMTIPANLSLNAVSSSIRSSATNECYPGEDLKSGACSALPIRNNQHIIFGHLISGKDMSGTVCPYIQLWKHSMHSKKSIIASVICHDRSVNPRILPTLNSIVGSIAYPIHVNLINFENMAASLSIKITNQSTQISSSKIVTVQPQTEETVSIPMPGLENAPSGTTSLLIEVHHGDKMIHIEDIEIYLLPDDYLPLKIHDMGRDWYRDTVISVIGWVTPASKEIDSWVSAARKYIAGGALPGGTQAPGVPQVEALWKHLEQIGVSYVDRSYAIDTSSTKTYQRVLTPSETIRLTSGNCIDLTVLFASALEQLSLSPRIVLEPGHAYIGWSSTYDGDNYLETTMLGSCCFSEALMRGNDSYQKNKASFNAMIGYRLIDVENGRKKGITPIFQ